MTSGLKFSARSKRSRASAESSEGSEQVCAECLLRLFHNCAQCSNIPSWACVGECCAPLREARRAGGIMSFSRVPAVPKKTQ